MFVDNGTEGLELFSLGYFGFGFQSLSIYPAAWNWIPLVIRLSGSWSGDISSTSVTSAKTTCLGFQINLHALSFQIGDRIRFRAIQLHDDGSVGITEGCDESEPAAQGGDEMIHPVGFAGTRIINLNLICKFTIWLIMDSGSSSIHLMTLNSGWGGRIWTLEITESESAALPLGDTPERSSVSWRLIYYSTISAICKEEFWKFLKFLRFHKKGLRF